MHIFLLQEVLEMETHTLLCVLCIVSATAGISLSATATTPMMWNIYGGATAIKVKTYGQRDENMYCRHCGRELPNGARFCSGCGKPVGGSEKYSSAHEEKRTASDSLLEQCNQLAEHLIPVRLLKRFPSVMPVMFVGLFAVALVIVVASVSIVGGRFVHDLSGTYRASEFFPVDVITFQTDGSFTAVSKAGYTETYQGKYSKNSKGEYTLRFTEGSVDGGSPVTKYEVSTIGQQYELIVEKVSESTLKVQVAPKMSYYAWNGTTVYFYKN